MKTIDYMLRELRYIRYNVRKGSSCLQRFSDNVLATGPKVRRFKSGRGRRTLKGDKNQSHDLLRTVSEDVGPML
jgi:hypothetical protein